MTQENAKQVYDPIDIQKILGLGRSKVYEFLDEIYANQKPFRVIRVGRLYKIPKKSFDKWVDSDRNV